MTKTLVDDPGAIWVPHLGDSEPAGLAELEEWILDVDSRRYPQREWCAMVCIRVLQRGLGLTETTLPRLYFAAVSAGVYVESRENENSPVTSVKGALHVELTAFVGKTLERKVEYHELTLDGLTQHIDAGRLVVANVSGTIRTPDLHKPEKRNGHFVVVYGYEVTDGVAYILYLDSTGLVKHGTHLGRTPASRFECFFSGRAISVPVD